MRIISFMEEPKIIDRIIAHLKLTFMAERSPLASIIYLFIELLEIQPLKIG